MNRSTRNRRITSRVSVILLAAAASTPALAVDKSWLVDYGVWGTPANWTPLGVPTPADNVFVGNTAGAENAYIELGSNASVANLVMTDGMSVRTEGFRFDVSGNASFSGKNEQGGGFVSYSGLRLGNGANAYDFRALNVTFADQARLDSDLGTLRVDNLLDFQDTTYFQGDGTINLFGNGATAMRMNGRMTVELGGLVINQFGDGRVDLDGTIADDNLINVTGYNAAGTDFAFLEINGDALTDAYNERFWVGGGNQLNMNLSEGWTLGTGGHIEFLPGLAGDSHSFVNGGTMTVNGLLEVFHHAYAQVNAPAVLAAGSDITIGEQGRIDFEGATTINGVTVTMEEGGDLDFDGPTTVISGTLSSFSDDWFDGEISFDGPTNWRGTVTLNGVARQNGDATVSLATVIWGQNFDMSGVNPFSSWTINAPLQVNSQFIGLVNNNVNGDIVVNADNPLVPAYLEINLPGNEDWVLLGSMTLNGPGNGFLAQTVRGSDMVVGGTLTVNGNNAILPRIEVREAGLSHGYININADSSLRLDGGSIANPNIMSGGRILGPGTLRASGNHALVGHGTIGANIEFTTTAEVRAKNGTLNITGQISDVGIIGTADETGFLHVTQPWNPAVAGRLELLGGRVTGATITNTGTISGHGLVFPVTLNSGGTISAVGGVLELASITNNMHLGGFGVGELRALDGDISVLEEPLEFNAHARVGPGRSITLTEGWEVGVLGNLHLNGAAGNPATIAGTAQLTDGITHVSGPAQFDIATTFAGFSRVQTTAAGDSLTLLKGGFVDAAATFSGPGELRNVGTDSLTLDNASTVGITLYNSGPLTIESDIATGIASAQRFQQTSDGATRMQFAGQTPGTQFDRLNVATTAGLAGELVLGELGGYDPGYLVPHEIVRADSISGYFDEVPGNKVAFNKYWAVTYDDDSVFATAALPGDANLDGTVNIVDFAILGANYNNAGPWAEGNFNGDLLTDIGDFSLLGTNFNTSIPVVLPRGSAVPEPSGLLSIGALAAGLTRRTRRR